MVGGSQRRAPSRHPPPWTHSTTGGGAAEGGTHTSNTSGRKPTTCPYVTSSNRVTPSRTVGGSGGPGNATGSARLDDRELGDVEVAGSEARFGVGEIER